MTVQHDFHEFASREALVLELAATVADALSGAIRLRGCATLAVSGGSTPGPFFDALSRQKLDWTKAIVTLVDDRFVSPDSDRSNEKLARGRLLVNEARHTRFMPLWSNAATVEAAAASAETGLALMGQPLDVVILGMGADGHTASFFPDAPNLDQLTDPGQARRVMPVDAPSGGEPRLTLTMPLIASARFLALHIEGGAKRAVLDRAMSDGRPTLPIRRVLDAAASTPQIYWTA